MRIEQYAFLVPEPTLQPRVLEFLNKKKTDQQPLEWYVFPEC